MMFNSRIKLNIFKGRWRAKLKMVAEMEKEVTRPFNTNNSKKFLGGVKLTRVAPLTIRISRA